MTVLRDRERRSFFTSFTFFPLFLVIVDFFFFNRKLGSRECPARVISSKIWPPFAALYVTRIWVESIFHQKTNWPYSVTKCHVQIGGH